MSSLEETFGELYSALKEPKQIDQLGIQRKEVERLKKQLLDEVKMRASAIRIKTEVAGEEAINNINRTIKNTDSGLICPICRDSNRGNIMNGLPFCFDCNHKLVPKSKLKNYNRAYRRAWKKRKK